MYRKFLLASAAAVAFSGSAALAADLPSRAPPPAYIPPPPIFSWTGLYVGGQVGYAWGTGNLRFVGFDPLTGAFLGGSLNNNPSGVIGGGHVGYQYQINQWVIGLEGSVDGTSMSVNRAGVLGGGTNVNVSTNADIQGSIRGKVGIAWDRVLLYATGGVAFGGFNQNVSVNGISAAGVPFFASGNRSTTRVGWTVGGGLQYAVTNNWWIFAEYRYTDFGTLTNTAAFPGGNILRGTRKFQENQVQVGFSYKFDFYAPPPVVAKY